MDRSKLFIDYLVDQGYDRKVLKSEKIKTRGLDVDGVIVFEKEGNDARVIQAFALMNDAERTTHRLFPFYRTMDWGRNNETVNPACSIATQNNDGSWTIYDAHNSKMRRDEDYLNYGLAQKRFRKRIDVKPVQEIGKALKYSCWGLAFIVAAYFALSLIFPALSFPVDMSVVSLFVLVAVLVVLPMIIPLTKGLSLFGIDFFFKNND